MRFPRHWAKGSAWAEVGGVRFQVHAWRGSDEGVEAAAARAEAAAQRAAARFSGGSWRDYDYQSDGLREEVLEELRDPEGRLAAVLTRNGYGASVLNAARVFFADLDFPPPAFAFPPPAFADRLRG